MRKYTITDRRTTIKAKQEKKEANAFIISPTPIIPKSPPKPLPEKPKLFETKLKAITTAINAELLGFDDARKCIEKMLHAELKEYLLEQLTDKLTQILTPHVAQLNTVSHEIPDEEQKLKKAAEDYKHFIVYNFMSDTLKVTPPFKPGMRSAPAA